MPDLVIQANNLGKKYTIGHQAENGRYTALRDVLMQNARSLWHKTRDLMQGKPIVQGDTLEEVWALKDVSFEIRRGEAVGIIGRNGAGKSTLLKILSRITEPSTGRVTIKGRVASLLEVGTGFHPELTGRENIYLNGAILGMTRQEIKRKFDEIVAFAEVEKYLDTPVKRYSSGMHVRLAFAVAAHLEPEILLVDEVLAVGDAVFQKKCLGKMGAVAKGGRTVLFISHNMTAIQSLCVRAIWLNKGRVASHGEVGSVISNYLQTTTTSSVEQIWPDPLSAPGNESIRLHTIRLRSCDGTRTDQISIRTPFAIEVTYWNLKANTRLNLCLSLYNQEGVCVFVSASINEPKWHGCPFPTGLFRSACYVPGDLLNDGMYRVVLLFVKDLGSVLYCHEDGLVFEVLDTSEGRGGWYGKWIGSVRPKLDWTTELVDSMQTDTFKRLF